MEKKEEKETKVVKESSEPTITTPDSVMNDNYERRPAPRRQTVNNPLTITIIIAAVACVISLVAGIAIGKGMSSSTTQGPGGFSQGQMPSSNSGGFGPGGFNGMDNSQQQSSSSSSSSSSTGST